MKKVINGKMYSTESARMLGDWDNGIYGNDFNSMGETLYRTKSGNYFLYGYGGPLTYYATVHGNNSGWGERIMPFTEERAKAWAEEKLSGEDYERIFGVVDDDSEYVSISASLPENLKEKMDNLRKSTGETISEFLSRIIREL